MKKKNPKVLFFIKGFVPSKEDNEKAKSLTGAKVCFRNANLVDTSIQASRYEDFDAVEGVIPKNFSKSPSFAEYLKKSEEELSEEEKLKAAAEKKKQADVKKQAEKEKAKLEKEATAKAAAEKKALDLEEKAKLEKANQGNPAAPSAWQPNK